MTNMLSRTADSLFWLNRYMDRVDSLLRLLKIHYILSLDKGMNAPHNWRSVLQIATYMNGFDINRIENNTAAVLHKIILDTENINSLKVILHRARENARGAQDYITKETWEEVNQMYHYINTPDLRAKLAGNEAMEVIEKLIDHSVAFAGIMEITMPRGIGWNFMSLGKYIERCYHTINILNYQLQLIDYNIEQPTDILHWRYLLLALSGYELYLKTYTDNNNTYNLLHEVILNDNFTRSVLYSLSRISIYLKKVLNNTYEDKEAKVLVNKLGSLYASVKYREADEFTNDTIKPFLEGVQNDLSLFSTQLAQHFFSYH